MNLLAGCKKVTNVPPAMKTVNLGWTKVCVGWILLLLSMSQLALNSTQHIDDDLDSVPENCTARQAKRHYRYSSIRDDILRKLRLAAPPNVTSHRLPAIPQLQSIIDEMCRQKGASCAGALTDDRRATQATSSPGDDSTQTTNDYADDVRATTMKILLFPTSPREDATDAHPRTSSVDSQQSCRFSFQSDIAPNDVVSATFGIYIRRATATHAAVPPQRPHMATWVLVYALWAVARDRPPERHLVHRRRIYLNNNDTGRWHHFSFLDQVRRWITNPHGNQVLFVQATDSRGEPLAVIEPLSDEEKPYKPYLELMVSGSQQTSRSKRTTELDCDDQSSETLCCRYPLVIDFDKFGWDWVIVPRRYSAFYCSGECPFLYMQMHGSGTHVRQQQQQAAAMRRGSGADGGPCCSPRRLSPISMLYYDDYENIVLGKLPEMIVEQCGCA